MTAIDDLRLLVRIADVGNLSLAARQLGWLPATASAALKRVETSLGGRLFERSTRKIRPTEAGRAYLASCQQALTLINDATERFRNDRQCICGPVRISAPSDLGRSIVRYWLDELQNQYPHLKVTLLLSDRLTDMLREDVDFALRYGLLDDSTLLRRLMLNTRRVIVGSPDYLAHYGEPQNPADLETHSCLVLLRGVEPFNRWRLSGPDGPLYVQVNSAHTSDDGSLIRQWAIDGKGLACKAWPDIADDVESGRLRIVLPDWYREPLHLQLLSVARQHRPKRLDVCADFLAERFAAFELAHPFPETGGVRILAA